MRSFTMTCVAWTVMLSYSVVYKVLKWSVLVMAFLVYHDKHSVLVEKRDEYLHKLDSADEQINRWSSESEENLILFVLICGLLSIYMIGWIVYHMYSRFN